MQFSEVNFSQLNFTVTAHLVLHNIFEIVDQSFRVKLVRRSTHN